MSMTVESVFGKLAMISTLIGLIPQIIKAYQTKSMKDVSLFMLINCWVCAFSWLIYGICIASSELIWSEIFCLIVTTVSVVQKIIYDR